MTNSVKFLEKQKLSLQVELNNLINSQTVDKDKINEIKSEILYLDKQIEKIIGKKEIQRRKELKNRKLGIEETNKKNYYAFKTKFKKISPMTIATNRMFNTIQLLESRSIEMVKVK